MVVALALAVTVLQAEPDAEMREIRVIGAGFGGTMFSPSLPEGSIDIPSGAFSEWINVPVENKIAFYRKPPNEDGVFPPRLRPVDVNLPVTGKVTIVFWGRRWQPDALAFPEPLEAFTGFKLMNALPVQCDFRLGDRSGRVASGQQTRLAMPEGSGNRADIVSLSIAADGLDGAEYNRALDSRLRLIPGRDLTLLLTRSYNPDIGDFEPGFAIHPVYIPIEEEPEEANATQE